MARSKKLVMISDITKLGETLARTIRANYQWSTKLRKAVKLHKAREDSGGVSIAVTVAENDENLEGMARAYEYGSGEKGKFGKRYRIVPKNFPFLQFEGTNDFAGKIVRAKEVWHPGVSMRGDIAKSVDAVKPRIAESLRVTVRKNIIDSIRVTVKEINKNVKG